MEWEPWPRRAFRGRLLLLLFAALVCVVGAQGKKKPPAQPLDLNSATSEELQQLPGIGPSAAQAIIDLRTKGGPFRRVEDLLAIRGISQRKFNAIRPYVTVGAAKPAKP